VATNNGNDIEKRLWAVANQLWANSGLRPAEFSTPVLGLIFLRYAEKRFAEVEARIGKVGSGGSGARRKIGKADYQAEGVIFLPPKARFSHLQALPEGDNIGRILNDAMGAIEDENPDLKGVLPRNYTQIDNAILVELIRLLGPVEMEGDAFGKVYEYFLGNFAMQEGQKGGVFYTPTSIVRLIIEIIEPYHGRIYDPACGSGGMFVQSGEFVKAHAGKPGRDLSVFGVEKDATTLKLAKMNLAVHGLGGDIREANAYYNDPHEATDKLGGRFDFVMANPPFNISAVDKDRLKDDPRFPFGMPKPDNANYLWIQTFYSALNETGRAGFVMANSAGDARGSELEIRKKLIQSGAVDVVVSIASNFFYTVTLPCTLWFFDKGKPKKRKNTVLFIDARSIYNQIDRAHRDLTPTQLEFLANIVRMYRGEERELVHGSTEMLHEKFDSTSYADVPGLSRVATIDEIEAQGWSRNPGRYVGVADRAPDEFEFAERLEELNEELEQLNAESTVLEEKIAENVMLVMERTI
jgi:type I restriction enzyme M protein